MNQDIKSTFKHKPREPNNHCLKSTQGFISFGSFVGQALASSSEDDFTFFHELAHYHQLISTPFGMHLAFVEWELVLSLSHALRARTKAGATSLTIPLEWYCAEPIGEPLLANQVAHAKILLETYLPWLLGNKPIPNDARGELGNLAAYAIQRANSGLPSISNAPEVWKAAFPEGELLLCDPKLGEQEVTSRDVLENAATATALLHISSEFLQHDQYWEYARTKLPRRYYDLLQSLYNFSTPDDLFSSFALGAHAIFDCALFGAFLPPMRGHSKGIASWTSIAPNFRFVALFEALSKSSPALRSNLFSGQRELCADACRELTRELGWPTIEEQLQLILDNKLSEIDPPFSWATDEFYAAFEVRTRRSGFMLPPLLDAIASFNDSIDTFVPNEHKDLRAHAQRTMDERCVPPRFSVPLWVQGSQILGTGDVSPAMRGYAATWYYMSHYARKMLTSTDLSYELDLIPESQIEIIFRAVAGVSPDQVMIAEDFETL